jgi:CHAT domain-containing protein
LIASGKIDEAAGLAKEIDQLANDNDQLEIRIKSNSPRYAALTQPQPLGLREIQQQVLDDDSLLLEYMLGDERSYLWAITRTQLYSFKLPSRAQIEGAAGRFYKLLTANQPLPDETFEQRQARVADANTHIAEEGALLSKLLLGPVADKLGTKRLLIVPDGALQYIPFQALTVPATTNAATEQLRITGNADQRVPLFVDHEIVNEPSASTLGLVMSDAAKRQPAPNSVAVFANPVFEVDDPRVKPNSSSESRAAGLSQRKEVQAFRDVGFGEGKQIPPLPASREEADAIMSTVPWRSGLRFEGFDASRATISSAELSRYRIVHFATHGFVDYRHPELSGLVLSLVDEQGNAQDGLLRMHDIYNLKLPVDLVVLSACNTGLGKDVKGEGLIGLTRGFMYAGASGVVASLWKVDDEATAELMKHFYEGIFQKNLSPAASLRESQLAMWRQKRWHAPYYWAAFVIQGEYNPRPMPSRRLTASQIATGAAVTSVLCVIAFLFSRRRRARRL